MKTAPPSPHHRSRAIPGRDSRFRLLGLALCLGLWQIAALLMDELVIASPGDTVSALIGLMTQKGFLLNHFMTSFKRIFAGILIGAAAGFALGLAAGLCREVKNVLEPFFWVLMSVPAVVVVVIAMLWFGMGSTMVIFIASVMLSPVVYVNTVKGMEGVDPRLIEMSRIYRFSPWMRIRHIYLMSLLTPLSGALSVVVGNGVRVVVLAEVLGTDTGIGQALSTARTCLETPDLFACVLLCLLIVFFFDHLILRPVQNRLTAWRS